MRAQKRTTFLAAGLGLLMAAGAAAAEKRDVTIVANDGVQLKATYYSPGRPGPGVLLFHQCNMDRKSWDSTANTLAARGIHVLTLDLRGFGESQGEQWKWDGSLDHALDFWRKNMSADAEKAYEWLSVQAGVDKSRMAAGGASCGVTIALLMAEKHPQTVKTLVLLSGFADARSKEFLESKRDLPVLAAASAEDGDAYKAIQEIAAASGSPNSKLLSFKGAGHGVKMFGPEPKLEETVVSWFQSRLLGARQ